MDLHMIFSAVIMILLISLLILVHEAGHFLAAKAVGVRVDKFGFGLPVGPTLFSKKIGETEILIHAFLLGGYVSFPDDEEECDLPQDSPQRFSNKTVGQRMFVIVAGVFANLILAYYLIFCVGYFWKVLPENKFSIYFEEFAQSASDATRAAGFEKNDMIYMINGTEIIYPVAVNKFFNYSKEFDGAAAQDIIDKKLSEIKELNPEIQDTVKAGTAVKLPAFTDEEPVSLTTAHITGIEKYNPDETLLTDNQKKLRDKINYSENYTVEDDVPLYDIACAISDTKKPIYVTVLRNDRDKIELKTLYTDKTGILGIKQIYEERYRTTNDWKSLSEATFEYVNNNLSFMAYTLGKLFTGKIPVSEMNGIIAITKIGTEIIAYKGIFQGLLLTAMISLNLAIINILPIPALDGGHLLFLIIEKVTGRPVSKKFVEVLSNFFFYLLVAFMILIIYNDIHAWIIGKI